MEITNRLEAAQYVRIMLGSIGVDISARESYTVADMLKIEMLSKWDISGANTRVMVVTLAKVRAGSNDAN